MVYVVLKWLILHRVGCWCLTDPRDYPRQVLYSNVVRNLVLKFLFPSFRSICLWLTVSTSWSLMSFFQFRSLGVSSEAQLLRTRVWGLVFTMMRVFMHTCFIWKQNIRWKQLQQFLFKRPPLLMSSLVHITLFSTSDHLLGRGELLEWSTTRGPCWGHMLQACYCSGRSDRLKSVPRRLLGNFSETGEDIRAGGERSC